MAVREWLEAKKKEEQAIQRKKQEEKAKLQSSEMPQAKKEREERDTERKPERRKDRGKRAKHKTVSQPEHEKVKTQPARPKAAAKENRKEKTTTAGEEQKKRLSYDEWLANKRKQDEARVKPVKEKSELEIEEKKPQPEQARNSRMKSASHRRSREERKITKIDLNQIQEEETEQQHDEPQKKKKIKKRRSAGITVAPAGRESQTICSSPFPPITPKPRIISERKQKVRYAQKSWEDFSDYVWSKLNETDGDMERPEPQGSDKPDAEHAENVHQEESDSAATKGVDGESPAESRDWVNESEVKYEDIFKGENVSGHNEVVSEKCSEEETKNIPQERTNFEQERNKGPEKEESINEKHEGEDNFRRDSRNDEITGSAGSGESSLGHRKRLSSDSGNERLHNAADSASYEEPDKHRDGKSLSAEDGTNPTEFPLA